MKILPPGTTIDELGDLIKGGFAEERQYVELDEDETRHLAGKHNQQDHAGGHGAAGRVQGRDLSDELDYDAADQQVQDWAIEGRYGDGALGHILEKQGFDGLPSSGSSEDIDRLVAEGHQELFRGWKDRPDRRAADMQEQFRTGRLDPGYGVFGNGVYAAPNRSEAELYGSTQRMALHKDAKVADYKSVIEEMSNRDDYDDSFSKSQVLQDPGRYAAAKGYDAIRYREEYEPGDVYEEVVVLNRTALTVQTVQAKRYSPDDHLARRHLKGKHNQKAHGHDGPASGGIPSQRVPIRDQNGVVLGSFDYDASKPMQPQVDAALKKLGMGGKKASLVREGQGAVRNRTKATPPKPASIKRAKTSTKGGKTKAEPEAAPEFPKRKGGTKAVKPTPGGHLTPAEYRKLAPLKVTAEEKAAIDFYDLPRGGGRGSGANDINWHMRLDGAMGHKGGSRFDKRTPEYTKNMRAAISRHRTPVDMVVTRHVHAGGLGVHDADASWKWDHSVSKQENMARKRKLEEDAVSRIVGTSIQDKGFVSTTLKPEIPGAKDVFGPYKMNLRVPKGTPAVFLDNPEQELVLGEKTRIAFLGLGRRADGVWEIDAQVVH